MEASPATRAAPICIATCLLLCPLISFFLWPVANHLIAVLATLG